MKSDCKGKVGGKGKPAPKPSPKPKPVTPAPTRKTYYA